MGLPVLAALAALALGGGTIGAVAAVAGILAYAVLSLTALRALRRLRRQSEEVRQLALHDEVTGLPNRSLFLDRGRNAIRVAQRAGTKFGILVLDLRGFREINDALGQQSADLLLRQLGTRLRESVRPADSVARLGTDEFAILMPGVEGDGSARAAARRARAALAEPFTLQGIGLSVEADMGAVIYPDHGTEPELLLRRADAALRRGREAQSELAIYSDSGDVDKDRLTLMTELDRAIDRRELVVHFQPKAELGSSTVRGVEALLRWEHPERGLLPPDGFIPVAESTGLIDPLTRYVLDAALEQCRAWRAQDLDLTMAVNLSTRNLLDPTLWAVIERLLREHRVPAENLELEVTETMMMLDPVRASETLSRIASLGCKIAVDDFGTGYTSLSWLKRLPLTTLKIDRGFVTGMERNDDDTAIVRSTINLARDLGLEVVAEGVEGQAAWRKLDRLGCDLAQGYLLSRPLPAERLTPWLHERILPEEPAAATEPAERRAQ